MQINNAVKLLESLKENPGEKEKEVWDTLNLSTTNEGSDTDEEKEVTFHDVTVSHFTSAYQKQFRTLREGYLSNLIQNLKSRFASDAMDIVSSFKVLNPLSFPKVTTELPTYGRNEMKKLSDHYSSLIDEEDLKSEWLSFKQLTFDNYSSMTFQELATIVIMELKDTYPCLAILYKLSLIISVSSADCERGFSVQNLIKTSKRSCMSEKLLHDLCIVKVEGPSVEKFDFTKALTKWKNLRDRRC